LRLVLSPRASSNLPGKTIIERGTIAYSKLSIGLLPLAGNHNLRALDGGARLIGDGVIGNLYAIEINS